MGTIAKRIYAAIRTLVVAEPEPHVVVRYVAATKRESDEMQRKRENVHAALRAHVTEQKLVLAVGAATREPITADELAVAQALYDAEAILPQEGRG